MEVLLLFVVNSIYNIVLTQISHWWPWVSKGFSNQQITTESTDPRELYSQRRDKFIFYTNYNEVSYKGGDIPKSDTVRSTLDTKTGRYLQKVISRLYSEKKVNNYLNEAKCEFVKKHGQEKIKEADWKKWEHIPDELLPELSALRWSSYHDSMEESPLADTDFSPDDATEVSSNVEEVMSQMRRASSDPPTDCKQCEESTNMAATPPNEDNKRVESKSKEREDKPCSSKIKQIIQSIRNKPLLISIIMQIPLLIVLVICILKLLPSRSPITDIHIYNDDISLKPGEYELLQIGVWPLNANRDLLQYQSTQTEVAYVEKWGDDWFVIASQQEWQNDACHETDIKVQATTVTETAHVTIEEPATTSTIVPHLGEGSNKTDDGDGGTSIPWCGLAR